MVSGVLEDLISNMHETELAEVPPWCHSCYHIMSQFRELRQNVAFFGELVLNWLKSVSLLTAQCSHQHKSLNS